LAVKRDAFTLNNKQNLSYLTSGSGGRAVVCVHGMGQSSYIWQAVIEALPPGWQGYALDLLGFGNSDKPESGYSIGEHASSVSQFIDGLPQREVIVAANSLGGVVAMTLALQRQARLKGMVLAATGARVRDPQGLVAYREHISTMPMTPENLRSIARNYSHKQLDDDILERLASEIGKAKREAMLETMTSSLDTDLLADLGGIEIPILVIQGMEDKGRPPADGLAIARAVKDGRLLVLPAVGHSPMLDAPDEFQLWLNTAISSWVGAPNPEENSHQNED
jgi:pimeloyl-ACP methyl ester carboxylesterase